MHPMGTARPNMKMVACFPVLFEAYNGSVVLKFLVVQVMNHPSPLCYLAVQKLDPHWDCSFRRRVAVRVRAKNGNALLIRYRLIHH